MLEISDERAEGQIGACPDKGLQQGGDKYHQNAENPTATVSESIPVNSWVRVPM